MTIFIASLFLPYTVNFQTQSPGNQTPKSPLRRPTSSASLGDSPGQVASLFNHLYDSAGQPTPPLTPGAITDHERIFLQNAKATARAAFPDLDDPRAIAATDPHSPTWGKNSYFNQPQSRADSPPPHSILKHAKAREKAAVAMWRAQRKYKAQEALKPTTYEQKFAEATWSIEPAPLGNGGLRNAVKAAENDVLHEKTWVGTLGCPTDALEDHVRSDIAEKLEDDFESLTVYVNDDDFHGHYQLYSKTILWPVFHYQIPDNPKSKAYEDHSWVYYVKINQAFADRIAKNWKRGDVVWVHDYHLFLVPAMLRKLIPDAQIGFFLHVAFPSSEVFRCLAVRDQLLQGVLGADLVGFQTEEYCHHFLQTCSRILNVEATNDGIQLEDRFVNVGTFPIGIDPKLLTERRERSDVAEWINIINQKYGDKLLIVARDKLDHIRGVRQKLLAYELFLNMYPEWRHKVTLIQVATPTTEQDGLAATVSDIVTRINSTHSTLAHQPLVYLQQDIGFAQYMALMACADVLMITSLREGMNLTCHEYIYLQDGQLGAKKHGSLILSEFVGSASVLNDHELLVNPWDYRQCAETIKTALEMKPDERERRWKALYDSVLVHTASKWASSYTETLGKVWIEHSMQHTMSIPRLSFNNVAQKYKNAKRRLFVLDYEGTLASWGSPTSIILTTPQRALDVLNDLVEDDKNIVYVMSGRMPEEMERLFRRVPNLGLIAENGCYLLEAGTDDWIEFTEEDKVEKWKDGVRSILKYYEERIEGSRVEERHCSMIFNYKDAVDYEGARKQAGECANHINDACASQNIHAIPIDSSMVIEHTDINKASAITRFWDNIQQSAKTGGNPAPEFLFVAGDGREDEHCFRWANKLGQEQVVRDVTTVTLGNKNTEATATLTQGVTGVLSTLQKLAALR